MHAARQRGAAVEVAAERDVILADDVVILRKMSKDELIGRSSDTFRYHMEIRGLGILNIEQLYGVASVVDEKKVELLVYLERWDDPRAVAEPLPGHTLGHTGILTRDGVLFSGDALYLEALWKRHPLPYSIDPDMVAESLRRIRETDFDWLVPGHGELVDRETAEKDLDFHEAQIAGIEALILERLKKPHTTEEAIAMVSEERGLSDNPAQYWLAVTTVKGRGPA